MDHRAKFLENGLQSSFLMAIGHDAMISGGHQSHPFLAPIALNKPRRPNPIPAEEAVDGFAKVSRCCV
jgi:hypothetical protein